MQDGAHQESNFVVDWNRTSYIDSFRYRGCSKVSFKLCKSPFVWGFHDHVYLFVNKRNVMKQLRSWMIFLPQQSGGRRSEWPRYYSDLHCSGILSATTDSNCGHLPSVIRKRNFKGNFYVRSRADLDGWQGFWTPPPINP